MILTPYLAGGDLSAGEALDDDVVSVIADDYHGEEGGCAKYSSHSGVQLTA